MRWPDDPYGKTLDDLDRKRTEVRNLKGKLRTERQQWEEERGVWREHAQRSVEMLDDLLTWRPQHENCTCNRCLDFEQAEIHRDDLRRQLGLDDEPTTPPEEERDG